MFCGWKPFLGFVYWVWATLLGVLHTYPLAPFGFLADTSGYLIHLHDWRSTLDRLQVVHRFLSRLISSGDQRGAPLTLQDSCDSLVHLPIGIILAWLTCCRWQSGPTVSVSVYKSYHLLERNFHVMVYTAFVTLLPWYSSTFMMDIFISILFSFVHFVIIFYICCTTLLYSDLYTFHWFDYLALHLYLHSFKFCHIHV